MEIDDLEENTATISTDTTMNRLTKPILNINN
jgi:hypothetical protein